MRFQAVIQIILIVLSLVMIFLIIRPIFEGVRTNQEEIVKFREAVNTAGQFNARLNQLLARADSFSAADLEALETYMPKEIDILSVSRDIAKIVEQNEMAVQSIKAAESENAGDETDMADTPEPAMPGDPALDPLLAGEMPMAVSLVDEADREVVSKQFTASIVGEYDQLKSTLADFEQNHYPLRLVKLDFKTDQESQALVFEVVLETYALKTK